MEATDKLIAVLRARGPIASARVSSAQAGCRYSYWGCVRYQIRIVAAGYISNVATERASSDRRSRRLARHDRDDLCTREARIPVQRIGRLSEEDCERVLEAIGE